MRAVLETWGVGREPSTEVRVATVSDSRENTCTLGHSHIQSSANSLCLAGRNGAEAGTKASPKLLSVEADAHS